MFACLLACSGMRYSTSNAILATIGTLPARGTMMLAFSVLTVPERVWSSGQRLGDVGNLLEEEDGQG